LKSHPSIVPLSPHSLTARPITLPAQPMITIVVKGDSPNRVYCDVQNFGAPCQKVEV
jgi:NAD kinase